MTSHPLWSWASVCHAAAMQSGRARRNRAWFVSGIVATVAVVAQAGPAPAQVDPLGPEVTYVEAYGPGLFGYEDCEGVVHTEEELAGYIYVELDDEVEVDTAVALSYGGSLADDLATAPTEVMVPAGEGWAEVAFALTALEEGELTITVEPGLGYVADADDTTTVEVTDEVVEVGSCDDDLDWIVEPGRDRQTIDVGEKPLAFFPEISVEPTDPDEPGSTTTTEWVTTEPSTTETTTTTEATTSSTTTTEAIPADTFQASVQAVPEGFDTPIGDGTVPPGLTYVDDEWSGAATTPGTYTFEVRLCFDQRAFVTAGRARPTPQAFPDVLCYGTLDAQVVVLGTSDTAPPATPVRTDARFAG